MIPLGSTARIRPDRSFAADILYLIFFLLFLSAPAEATTLSMVTLESPPAEFLKDSRGSGRNVDITRACLRRMGFESQVRIIPWKRALVMVENGTADGIIDAAYTRDRAGYLYFSHEPVYVEKWYAFKRRDRDISFDRDLGNAGRFSLGIARGFQCGGIIQKAVDDLRFKSVEKAVNNRMNINKLMAGRFDAFVGVKITILYHLKKMGLSGGVDMVPMTETGEPYLLSASNTYVAFSKKTMTPDMADIFSLTLRAMKEDGTVERIDATYR